MTFIFGKLVWALVQPGNLLLLCLLAGVFLLLRGRRRGELPVVLSAIGFLLLAVAPIGPAMMLVLEQRFPRPPKLPERIDGILRLGGAVKPSAFVVPRRDSLQLPDGAFAWRDCAGPSPSRGEARAGEGGLFPVGYSDARAMLGFVVDEGIACAHPSGGEVA